MGLSVEGSVGFVNGSGAGSESGFFFVVEVEFNDFFDTVFAKDAGHANAEVGFAVFAFEESGAGDEALLVVDNGSSDLSSSGTGSVPSGSAEEFGESSTAHHCVGSDFVEDFSGEESANGKTAVSSEAFERDHGGVAVAADYDTFDFGGVATEGLREEVFEASAIESAAHADDAVFGETHFFVKEIGHCVHGV